MSHYECPGCGKVYGCACMSNRAFPTGIPLSTWTQESISKAVKNVRKKLRDGKKKKLENDSIETIVKDLRRVYRNRRDDTSAAARKDPFLLEIARRLEKLK